MKTTPQKIEELIAKESALENDYDELIKLDAEFEKLSKRVYLNKLGLVKIKKRLFD